MDAIARTLSSNLAEMNIAKHRLICEIVDMDDQRRPTHDLEETLGRLKAAAFALQGELNVHRAGMAKLRGFVGANEDDPCGPPSEDAGEILGDYLHLPGKRKYDGPALVTRHSASAFNQRQQGWLNLRRQRP